MIHNVFYNVDVTQWSPFFHFVSSILISFLFFFCSFFSGSEIPPLSAVFVAVAVCRFVLAKSRLCLFALNALLSDPKLSADASADFPRVFLCCSCRLYEKRGIKILYIAYRL